jgi:hypothetical protein
MFFDLLDPDPLVRGMDPQHCFEAMLWYGIRWICMFFDLDPDPSVRGTDSAPALIIKQIWITTVLRLIYAFLS